MGIVHLQPLYAPPLWSTQSGDRHGASCRKRASGTGRWERRVGKIDGLASKDLAVSQPDRALVRVRLKGTCTAEEGLDAKTFRGFQLAGELFLLTSFFIEPELRREFTIEPGCGQTTNLWQTSSSSRSGRPTSLALGRNVVLIAPISGRFHGQGPYDSSAAASNRHETRLSPIQNI
jgi:hypothetical protein